ncbi:AI-2E family transporter, partial [Haloferax profundi]
RPDLGWWLVGLALFAVLAWVGFEYLGWVVFGLFVYYVARPIARRLNRRISSPTLDAGLTLTFIIVPVLLFIAAFVAVALGQAMALLSSDAVASIIERLPVQTSGLPTEPVDVIILVLEDPAYSSVLDTFGVAVGAFSATLFNVFLMLIFAFFLLVEDKNLSRWFETNVFGSESLTTSYLRAVDRGLTSVYFGYTLTIFAVIIIAAIIYAVFNFVAPGGLQIPSVLLLAVITGVFTLIPLVGRSVVYALIFAILSAQALNTNPTLLWVPIVFFVLMVLVFDNVVRTYIRPYLSGKSYHMALVMFAYLLGPLLFGWYGIFMGPLLMVLIVEFITKILPRLSPAVSGEVDVTQEGPELESGEFDQVTFDESPDTSTDDVRPG